MNQICHSFDLSALLLIHTDENMHLIGINIAAVFALMAAINGVRKEEKTKWN